MERNEERLYKIVKEKIINELMKVGSRRRSEMIYQEMLEEIRDRIRIFGKESEDK
jgi:ribosomal protein S7